MRTLLFSLIMAVWALPLFAQDRSGEIKGIIESQISAFQADDFAAAFEFASPTIQQMFGNSQNFGMMVQRGYPMVWRPKTVTFLELRQDAAGPVQRVLVTDQSGAVFALDYFMQITEKGWRINGVSLLPDLGAAA